MSSINKKLWSFNFGCMLAGSFIWVVSISSYVPVPEFLHEHPEFVYQYYEGVVAAIIATMVAVLLLSLMHKGFSICVSHHPFWVLAPSVFFVMLTFVSAQELLPMKLYAAVPAVMVVCISAIVMRFSRQKRNSAITYS